MLNVVNLKKTRTGIRCDRASFLGNPFDMKSEADRDKVCDGFRMYLWVIVRHGRSPVDAANAVALSMELPISAKWRSPTTGHFLAALEQVVQAPDGTNLLCWCSPRRCHCDQYVNYRTWVEQTIEGDSEALLADRPQVAAGRRKQ